MARPWLRLDAAFAQHPKLVRAGWPLRALWPCFLVLLKQNDGVLSLDDTDGEYLAACFGGDPDMWMAAVGAAVRVGLLVEGEREVNMGRAGTRVLVGLMTPNWREYQPDARAAGRDRQTKAVGHDASPGAIVLPREPTSVPGTSRPRAGAPAVPSRPVGRSGPEQRSSIFEEVGLEMGETPAAARVSDLRHRLGDTNTTRPTNAPKWLTIAETDPTLTDGILTWALEQENPIRAFLNQWVQGKVRPQWLEERLAPRLVGRAAEDAVIEMRSDAHRCADALRDNSKELNAENLSYWLNKHELTWDTEEFQRRVQDVVTALGVAS